MFQERLYCKKKNPLQLHFFDFADIFEFGIRAIGDSTLFHITNAAVDDARKTRMFGNLKLERYHYATPDEIVLVLFIQITFFIFSFLQKRLIHLMGSIIHLKGYKSYLEI